MTESPLESRVFAYCRVVNPRDEESFLELDAFGKEPKKGHRAKTVLPRAGFYATLNPFDLLTCPQGSFVNRTEEREVKAELDRFDGFVIDTPPIFCEFPESTWVPPEGTKEISLPEHANEPHYRVLMASITRHMMYLGNQTRVVAEQSKSGLARLYETRGYNCFKKLIDREAAILAREKNAPALLLGLQIMLDDERLTEQMLRKYIDLLTTMGDRKHAKFYISKREFVKDLHKSYR